MYNNDNDIQEQEELNEGSPTTDTAVRSMSYPKASALMRKNNRTKPFFLTLFDSINIIFKRLSLLFNKLNNSIKKGQSGQSSKSRRKKDSIRRRR